MTADTLPDEVDFVFCPEALPEEEVHRVVLVVEGMARPIPTSLITLADEAAQRVCDRLNGVSGTATATPGPRSPPDACAPAPRTAALRTERPSSPSRLTLGRRDSGRAHPTAALLALPPFLPWRVSARRPGASRSPPFESERSERRASARWKKGRRAPPLYRARQPHRRPRPCSSIPTSTP